MLSYSIGPTLGNVESGLAARAFGVGGSIVAGGVACVVGTVALAGAAARVPAATTDATGIARKQAEEALVPVAGVTRGNPVSGPAADRVCFLLVAALAQSARATHS